MFNVRTIVFVLGCIFLMTAPVVSKIHDESPYSSVTLKVKMKKVNFKVGEPVEGKITIENDYPANIPIVFKIRLYHDGYFVSEVLTSAKGIPFGKTEFTFRGFGVPLFNAERDSVGLWKIKFIQQHLDESYAKTATVRIVADNY